MTEVVVIVPVLGRPNRVAPLVESLTKSQRKTPVTATFVCSAFDHAEIEAVNAARAARLVVVDWEPGRGDYARKCNAVYRVLAEEGVEWMLLGADDLRFHRGWADAALAVAADTDACVIGTNDDGNPNVKAGRHATHSLVHADYLECGTMDADGVILHEGYDHNFVDNELVATAQHRGTFAFAAKAVVEHMHPSWKKGEWDATYTKGQRAFEADRALWRNRQRMLKRL